MLQLLYDLRILFSDYHSSQTNYNRELLLLLLLLFYESFLLFQNNSENNLNGLIFFLLETVPHWQMVVFEKLQSVDEFSCLESIHCFLDE